MSVSDTSGPSPQAALPLTSTPPRSRLRVIRLITATVVIGPPLGALAALALAAVYGFNAIDLSALAVAYALTTLGVTVGFHRHFAHRTFKTSRVLQAVFVILGSMAMQGSLLYWVSTHRRHHQYSDTADDPHSPHFEGGRPISGWRGFWHGHYGWMFSSRITSPVRFAPDLIRDRFIFKTQEHYALWAALGLLGPPAIALLASHNALTALEVFLWAGPVRITLVHQASWAVGSISHLWGTRPFATRDRSANNWLVAALAFGEGLQNNHHAFPWAAHHGFRWWEPDLSGVVIDLLSAIRLIWDVNRPSRAALNAKRRAGVSR